MHKILKLTMKGISGKQDMLNEKSNTRSYMLINGSKNEKKFFWCILTLVPGTVTLKMGHKIHLCGYIYLYIFNLFDSIFQRWKSCITRWRNLFSQQCLPWKSEKDNFPAIISMIVKNASSKKKKKKKTCRHKKLIWLDKY